MPPNFLDQPTHTHNIKGADFSSGIDFYRTVTATQKSKLISARAAHQ